MYTPLCIEKSNYVVSNRSYKYDYSCSVKKDIDMRLSGKFIVDRDFESISDNIFYKVDSYPSDKDVLSVKKEISKLSNVAVDNIILGAGANGIIQNLVKVFFSGGGNAIVPYYCFDQFEYAVSSMGGETKRVYCNDDFSINFEHINSSIDNKSRAVFICNPNNPTGIYEDPSNIINLAKKHEIPVIVCEAAIEYSGAKSLLEYNLPDNIIVIRSLSKAYGLAGLRVGYAYISDKYKSNYFSNVTQHEVSNLSLFLALKVLREQDILNLGVKNIMKEKNKLSVELKNIGISTIESFSNTLMTCIPFTKEFVNLLKQSNVSVVYVEGPKCESFIRIAVQSSNINNKFIKEFKKIIRESKNENIISYKF